MGGTAAAAAPLPSGWGLDAPITAELAAAECLLQLSGGGGGAVAAVAAAPAVAAAVAG